MLNLQTLQSALNAAQQAADKRQFFVALPGSPLADLSTEVSRIVSVGQYGDTNTGLINLREIADTMAANPEGAGSLSQTAVGVMIAEVLEGPVAKTEEDLFKNKTTHSLHMDSFIESLSTSVSTHMSFARNDVLPVVRQLRAQLETFYKAAKKGDDYANMLSSYQLPALLQDETFLLQIAYMDQKAPVGTDRSLTYKKKTAQELIELLRTNQEFYDDAVLPWAKSLDQMHQNTPSFIESVWTSFFTKDLSDMSFTDGSFEASLPEKTDAALLVYLFAQRLTALNVVDAGDLSLAEVKRLLNQTKDWAAASLVGYVRRFELSERTGVLILGTDIKNKVVTVYEPVLQKFLQSQGSLEAILGVMISGRPVIQRQVILDQQRGFEKSWESFLSYNLAKKDVDYVQNLREFLTFTVNAFAKDPQYAAIQDYCKENKGYAQRVQSLTEDYVHSLDQKSAKDLDAVALECGAKILFYFTDAYSILHNIERTTAANPQMNVREAALIAAICYVSDYLADQIAVS